MQADLGAETGAAGAQRKENPEGEPGRLPFDRVGLEKQRV